MKLCLIVLLNFFFSQQTPVAFSNVNFENNAVVITAAQQSVLDVTASALKTSGKHYIIWGYAAHGEGTGPHNLRISRERAQAVLDYLVNKGVHAAQLSIKYSGEAHPIAPNASENGQAANRRVEFRAQP